MTVTTVITPIGVLSYPALFSPRRINNSEPRFQLNLIFTAEAQKRHEYRVLVEQVSQAVEDRWPGKTKDPVFMRSLRLPFRSCAEREGVSGYDVPEGKFISAWSKNKPQVIDRQRDDITVPADVWPGQHARASVRPFAYDTQGNKGVSFGLQNVQITRTDTPRLDGRRSAQQEFPNDLLDEDDGGASATSDMPF